ncbi:metallophosphoesterase family protein [Quisquiliibacterium transsilvanicum]|uniref:Diadenosine tetraphosphatase ApaH/serine/threonine PP2A family protein phosphatase n=1 Tax=Quisquiliibacterium transsilvanicum TaxID=1549638 RepID=A0A7W8M921_9BURK|nr:metallophosphoesterase family protein [Quisquiliibacterium transsilvanicum]MBB5272398.1 diadenosine tetraphosphatase ApaH/serine/threonine PP2A family protein phosphatase [Quisquiliibacterium transsilvanicum]
MHPFDRDDASLAGAARTVPTDMRIAAISDILGNLPALEAVLADIAGRGADLMVQLGDAISGPLWPLTLEAAPGVLLFHATPDDDDTYLLEDPSTGYAQLRAPQAILAALDGIDARLVLCGHTHVRRVLALPDGRTVVNAGSVGLPAYTDMTGGFQRHENGSPHARYALVDLLLGRVGAAIVAVAFDLDAVSRQASRNGREDWATWLASGRA